MATQYFCRLRRRVQAVRAHPTLNGIDYLEVLDTEAVSLGGPRQRTLLVRCVKPLAASVDAANVRIFGGVRVRPIRVEWAGRAADAAVLFGDGLVTAAERDYLLAQPDPDALLAVRTDLDGDFSTYRLCLVEPAGTEEAPLAGFDPPLAEVDFSFKVECPSDFDCAPADDCPDEPRPVPPIDYLARDYASFRQLMLDRLAVTLPAWRERNAADLGIALVETLAYAADHASYALDAAATEAYLGTARRRPSVRRHARGRVYPMHDGCNARAWVAVEAAAGVVNAVLPRAYAPDQPTRLLTRVPDQPVPLAEADLPELLARYDPAVFELLQDVRLFAAHNEIRLYAWGDERCCLPRGATRATLRDDAAARLHLRAGDVLVFEEVIGPGTGDPDDADPAHRHAVRLTRVEPEATVDDDGVRTPGPLRTDELFDVPIVEIEWMEADALPFPLCLSAVIEGDDGEEVYAEDLSVALGNVVLADHGRTLAEPAPLAPTGERRWRPELRERDLTQRVPFDAAAWAAYDASDPRTTRNALSATEALQQDPRAALPDARLDSTEGEVWRPERDLLGTDRTLPSDRFDPDFVVEVETDGRARLRFGDNIYGRVPEEGVPLAPTYRVGSGVAGNIGADALTHLVTTPGLGVAAVRNPLPGVGGVPPESLEEVRQYAPEAFRRQERAVTEADYAAVAERHPDVSKAVARRRWTGSWHTVFLTVDRRGGRAVDDAFEAELEAFVARYQLAGHDVEVEPPRYVPLDLAFTVCVEPGHLRSAVRSALLDAFSRRALPDGALGFFHPDRFTFGAPVYLSQIVATAMAVPGVRWVSFDQADDPRPRFHRWRAGPHGEIGAGVLAVGRTEIVQLDNDPNAPENGKLDFFLEGGL